MKLIALSGGIAAGKSTVGRRFEELGAVRIDADVLAREAVAPGSPGLALVSERFGAQILAADGSLDRAKLAEVVFRDPEQLAALNGIVHPEVRRLFDEQVAAAVRENPEAVVIYDVPLLAEAGSDAENKSQSPWDLVVIVEAPHEVRIERMVQLRGMEREEAERRIANQADDEARRAIADVIIDTDCTEDQTIAQVDELWKRIAQQS